LRPIFNEQKMKNEEITCFFASSASKPNPAPRVPEAEVAVAEVGAGAAAGAGVETGLGGFGGGIEGALDVITEAGWEIAGAGVVST
jgi:hypothetical protein